MTLVRQIFRLTVLMALSLALPAVGLAHKPQDVADPAALSRFLESGGHLSDICAEHINTEKQMCEACHLMAATDIPPLWREVIAPATLRQTEPRPASAWDARGKVDLGWQSRAPPV